MSIDKSRIVNFRLPAKSRATGREGMYDAGRRQSNGAYIGKKILKPDVSYIYKR